jgi:hypothetical protein
LRGLRYTFPLALIAALLSVSVASGAVGGGNTPASIKTAGHATLVDPADVAINVTYSCLSATGPSSIGSFGSVSIEEGQNTTPAFGFGNFMPICDDSSHSTTVIVHGGPFTPGTAAAFATVCGLTCAQNGLAGQEIVIR